VARHSDPGLEPLPAPDSASSNGVHGRWSRVVAASAGGAVAVLVLGFCMPFVLPGVLTGARSNLPWFPRPACERTTVVEVVATPQVRPAIQSLTEGLQATRLGDGSCLSVRVREQNPTDTVASSLVLPPSRAPQIWVSDSSLWLTRVTRWKQRTVGSLGTTPVIMVSSGRAIKAQTWAATTPSWADLFQNARPLSVPDVAGSAQAQLAMLALWQTAGRGASADRVVAAATIASRRTTYASDADALSAIVNNSPQQSDADAAFVVTTESEMVAINRDSMREVLAPLYPRDGSPFLDFPIVRLAEESQDAPHRTGADLVIAALTAPRAQAAAHALGLRDGRGGSPPTSQRGLPGLVRPVAPPSLADLARFQTRFASLAVPSRLLVVMDVSLSMRTPVPGAGLTRLEAASRSALAVGQVLPGASSVGLWSFALNMHGDRPYKELAKVAPLGSNDGGVTHRDVLHGELRTMNRQLTGGGTGLYVTALAAVRALRANYDPRASNAVVLFTDGTNENDAEISLTQLVATLQRESRANPDTPVRLICVGLGTGIDLKALQAMSYATGGTAYQALTGQDLQTDLYDAISRRA
jgi:Ca-activated chloride channel homolog